MKKQILKLKSKAAVFIDWANVFNWKKSLKKEINPKTLFEYLKTYPQIKLIYFYFGEDQHPKSKQFLKEIRKIGYELITKPVKYIIVGKINKTLIKKRKCDFDVEITMKIYELLQEDFKSFIFFTGDGDFAPLYQYLLKKKKQVIVIYEKGFLGREIWQINKGLFKTRLGYLAINQVRKSAVESICRNKKNNPRSKVISAGRDC